MIIMILIMIMKQSMQLNFQESSENSIINLSHRPLTTVYEYI